MDTNLPQEILSHFKVWELKGRKSPFAIRPKGTRKGARFFGTIEERLAYAREQLAKSDSEREFEYFRAKATAWQVTGEEIGQHWITKGLPGYRLKVADAFAQWAANKRGHGAAGDIMRNSANAMIRYGGLFAEKFGSRSMSLVTEGEFKAWLDEVQRLRGPSARDYVISAVHCLYARFGSVLNGYNPAPSSLLNPRTGVPKPLSVDIIYRLLEIAFTNPRFSKYAKRIVCILCLGMRIAQACRLRAQHVVRDGEDSGIIFWIENNMKAGEPLMMVNIFEMFWLWWDAAPEMEDVEVKFDTMNEVLGDLFKAAGLKRTRGELRDSFASYGLKVLGEEATAYFMCHENTVTVRKYYAVEVALDEAKRFFAMRPGFLPPK